MRSRDGQSHTCTPAMRSMFSAIHDSTGRVIPDVIRVEQDPDLVRGCCREQAVRVGERVDEPGGVTLARVDGLEPDPNAGSTRPSRR